MKILCTKTEWANDMFTEGKTYNAEMAKNNILMFVRDDKNTQRPIPTKHKRYVLQAPIYKENRLQRRAYYAYFKEVL